MKKIKLLTTVFAMATVAALSAGAMAQTPPAPPPCNVPTEPSYKVCTGITDACKKQKCENSNESKRDVWLLRKKKKEFMCQLKLDMKTAREKKKKACTATTPTT